MPVLTRRRATRILIVAAACVPLLLAGGAALISVLIGQSCSGGAGVADSASQVAQRTIPADVLAIYEAVDARYRIPWEVLAGIGEEECDQGRNPAPSCTPQPGAIGPGAASCAGASGPMQIGVGSGPCGSAGDEYDQLRQFLPDPSLGPHDPATAAAAAGTYVNPFAGEDWAPSRNDQGVDYDPLKVEAISAIGAGTIVDIGSWGGYGP
jgi:hypothetical protein